VPPPPTYCAAAASHRETGPVIAYAKDDRSYYRVCLRDDTSRTAAIMTLAAIGGSRTMSGAACASGASAHAARGISKDQ
jgi:hypothetical protein